MLVMLIVAGLLVSAPGVVARGAGPAASRRLWADLYHGSPNLIDEATDVEVSPDGTTAFVTGRSDQSGQYNDYATIAYDVTTGTRQWVSRFNGPQNRSDVAYDLGVSPDGSTVFVTGFTNDIAPDFATIAYDAATGAERWHARYDGPGHGDDVAYALGVSPDGSVVYAAGYVDGPEEDYGVVAYDAGTGSQLWEAQYGKGGNSVDVVYALGVNPDGSTVFVTGASSGQTKTSDFATVAYDSATGNEKWATRYNGPQNDADGANALSVSPDGTKVFVTGSTNGIDEAADFATIAYDVATGAKIWISRYDGHSAADIPADLGVSPDGSKVFVSGRSDRSTVPFDSDYATVALDAGTGARVWVARYDHAGQYEIATALTVSPDGSTVYVAGEAVSDYMTIAYDAETGQGDWISQTRRHRLDVPHAVAVTPDGSVLILTGGMWQGDPEYMDDYGTIALSTQG
jgi:WD40 repeat protein